MTEIVRQPADAVGAARPAPDPRLEAAGSPAPGGVVIAPAPEITLPEGEMEGLVDDFDGAVLHRGMLIGKSASRQDRDAAARAVEIARTALLAGIRSSRGGEGKKGAPPDASREQAAQALWSVIGPVYQGWPNVGQRVDWAYRNNSSYRYDRDRIYAGTDAILRALSSTPARQEEGSRTAPFDEYGLWRCPDCGCHSHARIQDEGNLVRCVNCKEVFICPPKAPSPDATSGGEAAGRVAEWLAQQIEATHQNADNHPEGSGNRSFYRGQAIAYENALSLLEDAASQEKGEADA